MSVKMRTKKELDDWGLIMQKFAEVRILLVIDNWDVQNNEFETTFQKGTKVIRYIHPVSIAGSIDSAVYLWNVKDTFVWDTTTPEEIRKWISDG